MKIFKPKQPEFPKPYTKLNCYEYQAYYNLLEFFGYEDALRIVSIPDDKILKIIDTLHYILNYRLPLKKVQVKYEKRTEDISVSLPIFYIVTKDNNDDIIYTAVSHIIPDNNKNNCGATVILDIIVNEGTIFYFNDNAKKGKPRSHYFQIGKDGMGRNITFQEVKEYLGIKEKEN